VYAGIPETLRQIQSNGSRRQMAVLSNKPVNPSRAIVEGLGLAQFFTRIYGGNSFDTKKPDPLGVHTILKETGVSRGDALMVGDSSIDVLTGRNAGLATCGVTYGFAPHSFAALQPDVTVDTPEELGELFC
jgi:phosphoglycolate phosphatase